MISEIRLNVNIEYKGEAYALEKGKVYLVKVKIPKEFFRKETLEELLEVFKRLEINAVVVWVSELGDIEIQEREEKQNGK